MISLSRARPLAGVLAFLLGLGVAAPATAGEAASPVRAAQKLTLVQAAAVRTAAFDTSAALARAQGPAAPSATPSKPFFKTTKGVVSLILVAGATAWVVQSRIDNKVSSPVHQ
ncbi:MAG: hypothetical protein E6J47_08290 [Chloroflexi bacterium]|nr:MAG: hypothetical protein E6J47_08290 [Chloroflexota bacterium]